MNLSQAIIKKSLKRVNSDCVSSGVLDSSMTVGQTAGYKTNKFRITGITMTLFSTVRIFEFIGTLKII